MAKARARAEEVPRSGNGMALQQAKHYMRYMRHDAGEKPEAIALSEGVSVVAVNKSIKFIELHRALNTQQNLNTAVVSMLMGNLGKVGKTFERGFKAKNFIEQKRSDGSTRLVPIDDLPTQLKTVEVFGKFIDSMQPRGGGLSVKVQQNNANSANAISNVKSGGYEEMLHGILKNVESHNALPPVTADISDAVDEDTDSDGEEDEDEDEAVVQA